MGQGFDDQNRKLPPVAPPPRRVGSTPPSNGEGRLPEMAVFRGLAGASTPLPPAALPPRGRATTLLPVVSPPPRKSIPGESLGDSITKVAAPPGADTIRDEPSDFAMTTPEGRGTLKPGTTRNPGTTRGAMATEPLDWEEEEESTHVFESSRPPPPSRGSHAAHPPPASLGRTVPTAPASSGPRLVRPSLPSQSSQGLFRASAPPLPASNRPAANVAAAPGAPPTTDTLRLDAVDGYANGANGVHHHAGHAGGSPQLRPGAVLPPPPPIPSITQARPMQIEPAQPLDQDALVVRDQPFVKLPTGNPHTATELALKRAVVPTPTFSPHRDAPPIVAPRPPSDAKKWLLGAAGAAALLSIGALIAFFVMQRPGGVEVEVKDASGASVPRAEVFLDGRRVCESTPCFVPDVEVGRHTVRVLTAGEADREPLLAEVKAGEVVKLTVTTEATTATLVVAEAQPGLRLTVDGADRGPLPAKLTDLSPGKHDIKLSGERYKSWEKSIEVKAGETVDLDVPKLTVVKGRVLVTLKTEGASIVLVRADDPRNPKALDGPFPRPVEVPIESGSWKLIAKKRGYPDFVAPLDFSDGVAEKTIEVKLEKEPPPEPAAVALTTAGPPSPGKPDPGKPDPPPPSDPPAADPPASGTGFLNINSIPASRVLLDGQPLGETPKTGVSVSAGTHTVTFIHPEHGKKSVTVKVGPGETKNASARLKSD
jgi:serine/threonine-protein kinase